MAKIDGSTIEYRNPRYVGPDLFVIDCEINHPEYGWIWFSCTPDGTSSAIEVAPLYNRLLNDNALQAYVPPTSEEVAALERNHRNALLRTYVDPIASNPLWWADLTEGQQTQLTTYRQSLLDLPTTAGWPDNILWPELPSWVETMLGE